jgi:hypothetical protein
MLDSMRNNIESTFNTLQNIYSFRCIELIRNAEIGKLKLFFTKFIIMNSFNYSLLTFYLNIK